MMPLLRQVTSGVVPGAFMATMVVMGAFVGALGSTVSIRKFLKV
jgi:cell division protein FtsX